jgi:predicted dehydrogenase
VTVRLAIAGAGLIGRRHAEAIGVTPGVALVAIADPAEAAAEVAATHGVPHRTTLDEVLAADRPDGVILATPNQMHEAGALACVAAGVPAMIEKPLAGDLEAAERIVAAGVGAGVALLVGHHRRHNPRIADAKAMISGGALGRITAVQTTAWFQKPDTYFDTDWRRRAGAGPIAINLSHEIDCLRHLVGEIVSVTAVASNAARGFEVEDTAAVLLTFADGAVGTLSVSDCTPAPWSWELTAQENPAYPATGQSCTLIGGTHASLSLPDLSVWAHPDGGGWWTPIAANRFPVPAADPLVAQIAQFAAVIRGEAEPLVPASEGLATQRVIAAIAASARTGQPVIP